MNHSELAVFLENRWSVHSPRKMSAPGYKEAAVLVALTDSLEQPRLLLTQRSIGMPTHKGEVAFPGGKRDHTDDSLIETAIREAQEEVGLNPAHVNIVGELDQVLSIHGFLVTPVLAVIPEKAELTPDPRELESLFHVPLSRFLAPPDDYFRRDGWAMPTYYHGDYRIWGMTAFIIAEMMNRYWDTSIDVAY